MKAQLVSLVFAVLPQVALCADSLEAAPPTELTNKPVPEELRKLGVAFNNSEATITPLIFVDPQSHVLYYVESDGRHVSAIAPDGKLLWHRNPFVDAKLKPYRFSKPMIAWIGRDEHRMISLAIAFNSSQFGVLDPKTGDFQFEGQD